MENSSEKVISLQASCLYLLLNEVDRLAEITKSLLEGEVIPDYHSKIPDQDIVAMVESYKLLQMTQNDLRSRIYKLEKKRENLRKAARVYIAISTP